MNSLIGEVKRETNVSDNGVEDSSNRIPFSLADQISLSLDWFMTLPHCNGSLFDSSVTCINRSLITCGFCPYYMFVRTFNQVYFSFSA